MRVDRSRCFSPLSDDDSSSQSSNNSTISPDELLKYCEQLAKRCVDRTSRRGSLYCGGLGPHVYLRLRLAQKLMKEQENPPGRTRHHETTTKAVLLLQQAHADAQYVLNHTREDETRVTFLESQRIGAMCLLVVVEKTMAEYRHQQQEPQQGSSQQRAWRGSVDRIVGELSRKCQMLAPEECEVLYGRAGALAAIFYLRIELESPKLGSAFVVATATDVLRQGLKEAENIDETNVIATRLPPLLWKWHGKHYLGAAHGVVGILHILMHLQSQEWDQVCLELPQIRSKIKDTIASLVTLCHISGNLTSSLSKQPVTEMNDRLVQWCHGAPGHLLLLLKASQVFQEPKFLQAAEDIAEGVIWPRGLLKKGVGLCHGISGNGYSLLCLAAGAAGAATRNQGLVEESSSLKWKGRAMQYAKFAMDHFQELESIPDRPYSLYEGACGLCAFLLDCASYFEDSSGLGTDKGRVPRFPLYDF